MKIMSLLESKNKAGCVVLNNNKVLLIKKDKYELPKGKIKNVESPQEAAARETKEETGIKCHPHGKPYIQENIMFFLADYVSGIPTPSKKENISKCVWVDITKAKKLLKNKYKKALEYLSN